MKFNDAIKKFPWILTDGGIETKLIYTMNQPLAPHIEAAGLILTEKGRKALTELYTSYIHVANEYHLPMIIGTPTFRASQIYCDAAHESVKEINQSCVKLLQNIRAKEANKPTNIFIAGVIGPAHDAFTPNAALDFNSAELYHTEQANILAENGVDFLYAPTFPNIQEAAGTCLAMSNTGLPYVISFVLNSAGKILDGFTLDEAISFIDEITHPQPLFYSLSCIHPTIAAKALTMLQQKSRLLEIKANASALPTSELVKLDHLEGDEPPLFAQLMKQAIETSSIKIMGGCCGTDEQHIAALARIVAKLS